MKKANGTAARLKKEEGSDGIPGSIHRNLLTRIIPSAQKCLSTNLDPDLFIRIHSTLSLKTAGI